MVDTIERQGSVLDSAVGGEFSGLFDVADEPLALETELESSVEVGQPFRRPTTTVQINSEEERKMRGYVEAIMGRSKWRQVFYKFLQNPAEDTVEHAYDFFYNQFKEAGLEFEAELLAAVVQGFFGKTKAGKVPVDFETYRGKPSFVGKVLENIGLIKMHKGLMTHGEVFTEAMMEETKAGLNVFARENEEAANKFLEIMYHKGEELGKVIQHRFPKLHPTAGQRRLTNAIGHRIGLEIEQAIARDGVDDQGNIVYGGKIYNLTDSNDVSLMINHVIANKYHVQARPGTRIENAEAERSLRENERSP